MSDRSPSIRHIQILGADSPQGPALARQVRSAVDQLGIQADVELVTDMDVITSYQVMLTPALAVDGQLRLVGRVPPLDELRRLLER